MAHRRAKRSKSRSMADLAPHEVKSAVDLYTGLHDADTAHRKEHCQSLVNSYYDLATDFYEFGWGRSFHFAPRRRGESFKASQLRHQHFLADRLSLKPGMQILDVGCGVGGPMGNLARHTGASFVGINNNAYQIKRANRTHGMCSHCAASSMETTRRFRKVTGVTTAPSTSKPHPCARQGSGVPGDPPRPASGGLFRGL